MVFIMTSLKLVNLLTEIYQKIHINKLIEKNNKILARLNKMVYIIVLFSSSTVQYSIRKIF
jgi:hypothetical protein